MLPGNGDATFGAPRTVLRDAVPLTLVDVIDVTGDARADIVITASSELRVMVNAGDGTFTALPAAGVSDSAEEPSRYFEGADLVICGIFHRSLRPNVSTLVGRFTRTSRA